MSCDLDLPAELVARPLALVGLTGLDVESNPTHLAVWNSFASLSNNQSNSRVDQQQQRPPLNFLLFPDGHVFPPAKPDRASYEWYIPKGILKRKWMSKHLNVIPGVLVLFVDLEWDDVAWKSKHADIASRLHSLRSSLTGRGTKLVLVLLQGSAPLPSSEDVLAADRAASLCQACELSPKSLFVLPYRSDHLQGYTLRLEGAFYELAQSSYHLTSRAVRGHRDQLNRTNHKYLYVRHQFKMGFYHELKQDVAMAHKHYSQSYAHLLELRITDANVTEVKIVAGYIGYKVWRLSFLLNLPREAIAHFRSHIDFFRLRVGHPLGRFEHHAWLANQFTTFGRLFEDAIELGLPAIQTQHPGFYYQQAASQAVLRKRAVLQDFKPDEMEPLAMDQSAEALALEFYGQRPWRPARLSLEPADMKAETDGLAGLLAREKVHVDLTSHIVGALTAAVNQFKNHRSPRMKQYLLVQMAEEYSRSGNYPEALTLLDQLLWDYRKDFWWIPLTSLLQLGLRCAYLSASVAEYFAYAVELCSAETVNDPDQKKRLLANLQGILRRQAPSAVGDVDPSESEASTLQWRRQLNALPPGGCVTTVVTNTLSSFFRIRASFTRKQFAAEETVGLEVHVKYTGPAPLQLNGASVALNNSAYSPFCRVAQPDLLQFEPGQIRRYSFEFRPESADIGGELQIASVTLEMGWGPGDQDLVAYLRCEGASSEEMEGPSARRMEEFPAPGSWNSLAIFNSAEILPRTARVALNVDHDRPALKGEVYPLVIRLTNEEDGPMVDVELTAQLIGRNSLGADSIPEAVLLGETSFKCGRIEANGQTDGWTVLVRPDRTGTHQVHFQVSYEIHGDKSKSRHSTTVELEAVEPLQFEVHYQTMQFQPLDNNHLPSREPCLAVVTMTNCSPISLVLSESSDSFRLCESLGGVASGSSALSGLILKPGEAANDVAVLVPASDDSLVTPGTYSIGWKRTAFTSGRVDLDKLPVSSSTFELSAVQVKSIPLHLSVRLPAHGHVRQALNAALTLSNTSSSVIELDVSMSSNDAFMFAGNKQVRILIYPGDDYTLTYNLYPLLPGFVALPPIQFRQAGVQQPSDESAILLDNNLLDDLVARYVPTHIYVLPQSKEKSSEQSGGHRGAENVPSKA